MVSHDRDLSGSDSTSGTLKLYLYDPSDDTTVTWTQASANVPVLNGPLALGLFRWNDSRFYGLLDEVVVFRRVDPDRDQSDSSGQLRKAIGYSEWARPEQIGV